ncbi:hypothetical protein VTK56DRAFT_926 [Thermocarpiscus australiensis]
MQLLKLAVLLAAAALGSAENTVTFVSQDSVDRTVYFTGNPGMPAIDPVQVAGRKNVTVEFPYGWTGNFYAVSAGAPNVPGMLGEVAFNSWNGITFFDVSAIVNPADHVGVKKLYPATAAGGGAVSGCDVFPCASAYYLPDDVQTQSTAESDLICTLGGNPEDAAAGIEARDDGDQGEHAKVYAREYVLGRGSPSGL